MSCPLSSSEVRSTLTSLESHFTTDDFIAACPNSGGTRLGSSCAAVASSGSRVVCGRGVSGFARAYPNLLNKVAIGPPARWEQVGQMPATPEQPAPRQPPRPSTKSDWATQEQSRQVHWKEATAGISARGLHNGQAVDYLLPREDWALNLVPEHRSAILAHLESAGIVIHEFAHHVRSSQVFALNLAAPFFAHPDLLRPILTALLPPTVAVARVDKVEAEVVDPQNRFHEPGDRGTKRTSSDLGIWWTDTAGRRCLLLVEVKYTEAEFGSCKKGHDHGGTCDTDGRRVLASDGALCPLSAPPHGRTYWKWMRQLRIFRDDVLATSEGCPFRHDGYQLMRNQLLAAVLEQDPDVDRVDFAVMLHDDNRAVRALNVPLAGSTDAIQAWRGVLRDPSRFHELSPRRWLEVASREPALAVWATAMLDRYFGEVAQPEEPGNDALKSGHWSAARWLDSPTFAQVKAAYDEACGPGAVYFRVVDGVLNAIALHPNAPGYVGHRTSHEDKGYVLRPGMAAPPLDNLRQRHAAFEAWLPTVGRVSAEEQAIIPWLSRALRNQLWLPELGPGWAFLNQEWRFIGDDGKGRKSDVLAVHLPTGQLGIVEAKSSVNQLGEAEAQVRDYQRFWQRDQHELAPFFTSVLRTMGRLYGNQGAAAASVVAGPAALFVAAPGTNGMRVRRV